MCRSFAGVPREEGVPARPGKRVGKPQTLNPEPYTLINPEPETRNPKPSTLKPTDLVRHRLLGLEPLAVLTQQTVTVTVDHIDVINPEP